VPDFSFGISGAESVPFAAAPIIALKLQVVNAVPAEKIHSVTLRAQIQIEATRRQYSAEEKERLRDLFGDPDRWSRTLRPMLWTHASVVIPAFSGSTSVDLQIPCTFDFNVAATKYFHGVAGGEIPLILLFSGTVFYEREELGLQAAPIPWDKEVRFPLPVQVWKRMMDDYYPSTAWLTLRRDVFERLYDFKVRNGIASWEEAFDRLLATTPEAVLQ
jgi:hypothetical protein